MNLYLDIFSFIADIRPGSEYPFDERNKLLYYYYYYYYYYDDDDDNDENNQLYNNCKVGHFPSLFQHSFHLIPCSGQRHLPIREEQ